MKKWLPLVMLLVAIALVFACNKQKPPKLDYTEKAKAGVYPPPHGLPGENYVGSTPTNFKYMTGYDASTKPDSDQQPEIKPEDKKPEPKPEDKKPEENKPPDTNDNPGSAPPPASDIPNP